MIKLATWNVNSLKIRLEQVLAWLKINEVDILALQETKLTDENFPTQVFEENGYHVAFSGQKTYNGVAVISRYPLSDMVVDTPYFDDPQRRILGVTVAGLRLLNLYVPNGSEVGSDKYQYKLAWLSGMQRYLHDQRTLYPQLAVVGDFNIAPADKDVYDPVAWEGSVLVSSAERSAYQALLDLGLHDSFRHLYQEAQEYSWWDYRAGAFRRNNGVRIDHILLSDQLLSACQTVVIDKEPRRHERPSDHAPVLASLDLL
jgi:exodeoxyribonuclease-3